MNTYHNSACHTCIVGRVRPHTFFGRKMVSGRSYHFSNFKRKHCLVNSSLNNTVLQLILYLNMVHCRFSLSQRVATNMYSWQTIFRYLSCIVLNGYWDLLASKRDTIRGNWIYIYILHATLVVRARCYVMWEEL